MEQLPMILIQGALGFSLAACAGIRAFLPLLVIGILARTGYMQVGESFSWISSTPALITFGTAALIEILGDKIPAVDHFLDSAGVAIKPVAATILFATVIVRMDPLLAVVLGLIAGGSIAEVIHIKKAALRLASTGATGGLANPVISIAEDVGASAGIAFSILFPIAAAVAVVAGVFLAIRFYGSWIRKKKAGPVSAPGPTA